MPRLRYDQLMHVAWKVALPIALVTMGTTAVELALLRFRSNPVFHYWYSLPYVGACYKEMAILIPPVRGIAADAWAARADFALWGLSQFMLCLLSILVLARYRSMIPFMFALLLLEYSSRKLILHFLPVVKIGTPPGFYVNLILLALMIVGLALSLWSRGNRQVLESAS